MNNNKTINNIQWTAAAPWLLLLVVVLNGGMFGGVELNLLGSSFTLYLLLMVLSATAFVLISAMTGAVRAFTYIYPDKTAGN